MICVCCSASDESDDEDESDVVFFSFPCVATVLGWARNQKERAQGDVKALGKGFVAVEMGGQSGRDACSKMVKKINSLASGIEFCKKIGIC